MSTSRAARGPSSTLYPPFPLSFPLAFHRVCVGPRVLEPPVKFQHASGKQYPRGTFGLRVKETRPGRPQHRHERKWHPTELNLQAPQRDIFTSQVAKDKARFLQAPVVFQEARNGHHLHCPQSSFLLLLHPRVLHRSAQNSRNVLLQLRPVYHLGAHPTRVSVDRLWTSLPLLVAEVAAICEGQGRIVINSG